MNQERHQVLIYIHFILLGEKAMWKFLNILSKVNKKEIKSLLE